MFEVFYMYVGDMSGMGEHIYIYIYIYIGSLVSKLRRIPRACLMRELLR